MATIQSGTIRVIYEDDNFLVVDKPSGIPTHAPNDSIQGVAEILGEARGLRLGVHQRLDAATSGVLAFSKSAQGATRLGKAFELRNVKKTYRALVCGIPKTASGQWTHTLVHEGGVTKASPQGKMAKLRYRTVATIGPFALLEIDLMTGITHQIRVQCALEGMPILGDALYGGGNCFERLCLHAQRLLITSEPNLPAFYAKPPMWLDAPKLDKLFSAILSRAMDPWRNAPGGFAQDEVFRVFVPQHSGIPEIVVERLGRTLLVRHLEPDADTLWREGDMRIFAKCALRECQCDDFCYRVHESASKRHACRSLARAFDKAFDPFVACEQGIAYQFDLSGNATGLYLDQRDNRHWIAQNASGSVINLFAYTCAFSVCAAMNPNVTSTTSIDAAPAALKKGRLNFERNHIDLNGHRFIKEDAIKYLSKCVQNGTKFDTIICDPPSFGRFEKNVFSLEDDLNDLLSLCCRVAAPGALMLFSINHRKIRLSKLRSAFKEATRNLEYAPKDVSIFVNDETVSVLGVGTDLKTIRCRFSRATND